MAGSLGAMPFDRRAEIALVDLATCDRCGLCLPLCPPAAIRLALADLIVDAAKVEELMGAPPEKVPEIMALMGDSIDNIPGAKGIGESALIPVAPAIANAIYDAVGVRIDEVPMSPPKVRKAIQAKAAGGEPRFGPRGTPSILWPEALYVPTAAQGGDGRAATRPAAAK